ncbi:hypothetical protein K504DRAFT_277257 [Pleomassaria siparia CBS 279.74]|uniref:Uncharacterized protein n=1 Tax=Pleomassaria siparia CBS 279.74 TaxID=1314801 RepID=A0A6G1K9R8_9PLEO|nr:hypothetical protein K504DRAFT_277257 [Pleomassaria siparia CBS 279.74]
MGVLNPTADPANVVQALVYTLMDVFDASRDLYQTLRHKEKRGQAQQLRARGYPQSRRISYVEDDELQTDESIVLDKAAVTRQFEIGFQDIGSLFSVGDVFSQTALQSQIISLQSVIITTFLYGPTSPEPITHHLSSVIAACRAARTIAVDVLAAQHERQSAVKLPPPRSTPSPPATSPRYRPHPYPVTVLPSSTTRSNELVKYSKHETRSSNADSLTLANPTINDLASRPKPVRTDTELTSYVTQNSPNTQYCLYARDLQRHPSQALHSSITSSDPYCPYCKQTLHLSPGKSWEIFKDDDGMERCFQIQNRFVVKCHREGADGGYSCILCSRSRTCRNDTVCGDVKALIRHIWMDHDAGELEDEQDAIEVLDERTRRRDSGMSFTESRRSRRSTSLNPKRSQGRRRFEREVETLEIRSKRDN